MELAFLLVLFFVFSLIQQAARKNRRRPPAGGRPRLQKPAAADRPREQPQNLRDLFAEVRRQMEEAQLQGEREARGGVLEADALDRLEERASLEVEPVLESLEAPPIRGERAVIDLDDQAEAVIQRRLNWAEEIAKGRKASDHEAFDQRIRRPRPAPKAVPAVGHDLRQMVVWREVLGRPVGLRDPRDSGDPSL